MTIVVYPQLPNRSITTGHGLDQVHDDEVVVSKGIDEGHLVAISPGPNVIDGMPVKVNGDSGNQGLDDGAAGSGD